MKRVLAFLGALFTRLAGAREATMWPPFSDQSVSARFTRHRLANQYFGVYAATARRLGLGENGRWTVKHLCQGRTSCPTIQDALVAEIAGVEARIVFRATDDVTARLRAARARTGKSARRIAVESGISRRAIEGMFGGLYPPGMSVRKRLEAWLISNESGAA